MEESQSNNSDIEDLRCPTPSPPSVASRTGSRSLSPEGHAVVHISTLRGQQWTIQVFKNASMGQIEARLKEEVGIEVRVRLRWSSLILLSDEGETCTCEFKDPYTKVMRIAAVRQARKRHGKVTFQLVTTDPDPQP